MGLGKTIQAIAATEILARHFGVKKVLIICPTSLKFQWKREIEKFTDRDALVVEGIIHKRKDLYTSDSFYKIISYGLCRNDLDYIHELNANLVIMDKNIPLYRCRRCRREPPKRECADQPGPALEPCRP